MESKTLKNEIQYEIEGCLGEGLTSCVYKAFRKDPKGHMSELVALKILKSKKLVENWKNEFTSLAQVQSQYCVKVICWDWIQNGPGLVLEYIHGVRLDQLIEHTNLTTNGAQYIMWQIFCGLKHLNDHQLFHGDLSLRNVMVDVYGQVKLIDFGLSNLQGDNLYATPGYMAPELAETRKPNFSSDLYSLGVIAQKLGLTEKKFKDLTATDLAIRKLCANKLSTALPTNELAEKVKETINHLKFEQTKIFSRPKKKTYKLSSYTIVASLMLCFLFVSGSVHSDSTGPGLWLSVVTKEWVHIKVDGKNIGYTPIFRYYIKAGKRSIKWQSARLGGEIALTLSPNKNIVLNDADLGIDPSRNYTRAH